MSPGSLSVGSLPFSAGVTHDSSNERLVARPRPLPASASLSLIRIPIPRPRPYPCPRPHPASASLSASQSRVHVPILQVKRCDQYPPVYASSRARFCAQSWATAAVIARGQMLMGAIPHTGGCPVTPLLCLGLPGGPGLPPHVCFCQAGGIPFFSSTS